MAEPTTAADVYRHSLNLLLGKDMDGWVALCDDDVVIEFPFAPEGFPSKLEGKTAVAAYMRGYPDHIDLREIPQLEIHQTLNPGTIIAEWRGIGRMVDTDLPYDMPYVAVVTVTNGRITHYRDYWNPLAILGSQDDAKFFPAAR
jgi:uncharacterized protein